MNIDKLLNGQMKESLFEYTQEEVDQFHGGFDKSYLKNMYEAIMAGINYKDTHTDKLNRIIDYIEMLSEEDLDLFDKDYIQKHTDTNPNMLWNMLSKYDKAFYKTPDEFYNWFSKIDDEALDSYILRAADGKKLHPDYIYNIISHKEKEPTTKVEILNNKIAISSSNLKALEKFRDRVLASNSFPYEHRIKHIQGVKIHSYVFDMSKNNN